MLRASKKNHRFVTLPHTMARVKLSQPSSVSTLPWLRKERSSRIRGAPGAVVTVAKRKKGPLTHGKAAEEGINIRLPLVFEIVGTAYKATLSTSHEYVRLHSLNC